MWKIDLGYRDEMQATFDRLFEKKQDLQSSRPLPNIALHKIRESLGHINFLGIRQKVSPF